jgi:hypothetical protein
MDADAYIVPSDREADGGEPEVVAQLSEPLPPARLAERS